VELKRKKGGALPIPPRGISTVAAFVSSAASTLPYFAFLAFGAQGFAAHGFLAAQGFFAAQGLAPQGLATAVAEAR